MKMWMSKPTKTAFFSLIISSFLDELEVTSFPQPWFQLTAALELDLEQFNDDNFSSGGIIAVYWDMGLAANSVPSTTSVTLTMVLRTPCMVTRRRHNEIIIMSPEPDGAPGKKDQTITSGQRIWECHGMSASKVDFKMRQHMYNCTCIGQVSRHAGIHGF